MANSYKEQDKALAELDVNTVSPTAFGCTQSCFPSACLCMQTWLTLHECWFAFARLGLVAFRGPQCPCVQTGYPVPYKILSREGGFWAYV